MKSVMLWALAVLNVMLLAVVIDRQMKPNTAHAAGGRLAKCAGRTG